MQVKGSMMMFVVKGVRAAGVEHFEPLLTVEDRGYLTQRILPINWYPFANYKRLFDSLVSVVARATPGRYGSGAGTTDRPSSRASIGRSSFPATRFGR